MKNRHWPTSQLRFELEVILLKNISSWLAISHQKSGLKFWHWHMAVLYSVFMMADSESDVYFALNNYPEVQGSKKLKLYD